MTEILSALSHRDSWQINEPTLIYADSLFAIPDIGENLFTGHFVLIRENCVIGNNVSIGTHSEVGPDVEIGNNVRIHSKCFIPELTVIKDDVWIGPCVTFTNSRYPNTPTSKAEREGVTVKRGARIGAGAVILPGVTIGEDALVGAGAVVTKDVAAHCTIVGNPAKSINDTKRILSKLPLPQVACSHCSGYCVWRRYEGEPSGNSWLECLECEKKYDLPTQP